MCRRIAAACHAVCVLCLRDLDLEVRRIGCVIECTLLLICVRFSRQLVDQHLLVRGWLLDAMCEGEQFLLCDAPVRLAAQKQVETAEALVHVLLCEQLRDGRVQRSVLLHVEEIEHRAARLWILQTQQGGDVCMMTRNELVFREDVLCRIGGSAEEIDEGRFLHRCSRHGKQNFRCLRADPRDGENGGDAIRQRTVCAERGEDHRACKRFLPQRHAVPREDARAVFDLLALHLIHCAFAEIEEGGRLLRALKVLRWVECLGKFLGIPNTEVPRHKGEIAGNALHVLSIGNGICDFREYAFCCAPCICFVLYHVQIIRDEQNGVRLASLYHMFHTRDQFFEISASLAPQPDHCLNIVRTFDECVRLLRILQHAEHQRELLLVHTVGVCAADADGCCNGAAHGREADEIVLCNQLHHIGEVLLPATVHRLADCLPQPLLQLARKQEFSDEFHKLCIARLENSAEYLVGEDIRIVLAEEHITDNGDYLCVPAIEPQGDLFGQENISAVLFAIIVAA